MGTIIALKFQNQSNHMSCPIFISYKRVDLDRVKPIKEFIESKTDVKCWMDLDVSE